MIGAGITALLFVLFVVALWTKQTTGDPRPRGTVDDIAHLKDRDDLNVVFFLIDTLRSDRLSAYGYERETSPVIERMADEGVRFARHLSQSSWTKASMASIWTSMNPARSGITRFDEIIPDVVQMPAEVLKQAGFQTVGLYRNGWVSPNFGFGQGFDVYIRPPGRPLPNHIRQENPTLEVAGTDEDLIREAIEFLRVNGRDRFFLYVHLMDVHEYTYDEQSALFGTTYSDVYDNAIHRVDSLFGVLLDYLDESGLSSKTLVVVASDHGEAFRERGIEGHARAVYRETTEVPLVFRLPFRLDHGIVVETRTRNVDVWPTLLDLLGLEVPDQTDGRSLVPVVVESGRGGRETGEAPVAIAHLDTTWGRGDAQPQPSIAVVEGPYRYVRIEDERGVRERLFNSADDPRELRDLARSDPDKVAALREVGDRYLEEKPPWGESPRRELSEMELNQLRALGYALP